MMQAKDFYSKIVDFARIVNNKGCCAPKKVYASTLLHPWIGSEQGSTDSLSITASVAFLIKVSHHLLKPVHCGSGSEQG